jgi:hypothetical protein
LLVVLTILSINFVIFVKFYSTVGSDPVLSSLYSFTFPLIPLSQRGEGDGNSQNNCQWKIRFGKVRLKICLAR